MKSFVVKAAWGQYEDRGHELIAVFTDKTWAQEYVEAAQAWSMEFWDRKNALGVGDEKMAAYDALEAEAKRCPFGNFNTWLETNYGYEEVELVLGGPDLNLALSGLWSLIFDHSDKETRERAQDLVDRLQKGRGSRSWSFEEEAAAVNDP